MQFLRSYHVQHATWPWASLKVQKYWSVSRVPCEEHPCKVTTKCRKILRSHQVYKVAWPWAILKVQKGCRECSQSVHKAAWPWASLKVQKGHTKVNVELVRDFYIENIHIKLQHDTGNMWRVIAFTRFQMPPTQETTIPLQPKVMRGKKGQINEFLSSEFCVCKSNLGHEDGRQESNH